MHASRRFKRGQNKIGRLDFYADGGIDRNSFTSQNSFVAFYEMSEWRRLGRCDKIGAVVC